MHTIESAAQQGVHIQSFGVWMPWPRAGQPPDYSDAERAIAMVLARDPAALLIPRFNLDAPAWWRKEHSAELMLWSTDQGLSSHVDHPNYVREQTHVSPASGLWRQEAGRNLESFITKRTSHKLVVAFYGYEFELGRILHGIQQGGHLALGRLLKCPDVDILCGPVSYFDRGAGGIGAYMTAVDSVPLHGKLWCNEDDTRTFMAEVHPQKQQAGGAPAETRDKTRAVHQRNFSHLLPRRTTCWWMDLGGLGWLDDEGIWRDLGELKCLYDGVLGRPSSFRPEIAVIVDEKSSYYLTQKPNPLGRLLYDLRGSLYRIGAPCGYYLLSDLTAGKLPPAKMYLFLNCFALDDNERAAIARQCDGKSRVFFYAAGLINTSADPRNMEHLLQAPITISPEPVTARLTSTAHGLFHEVGEWGSDDHLAPIFSVDLARAGDDPTLKILARYQGSEAPAAWVRHQSGATYYLGALQVPAKLLRKLARDAGVHIYCDSDDVVEADQEFLAIHASTQGEKRLVLPRPASVEEAVSGKSLGTKLTTWTENLDRGDTRLYKLRYE